MSSQLLPLVRQREAEARTGSLVKERMHELPFSSALVYHPERIISLVVYGISNWVIRKTFNRFKIGWWPEVN